MCVRIPTPRPYLAAIPLPHHFSSAAAKPRNSSPTLLLGISGLSDNPMLTRKQQWRRTRVRRARGGGNRRSDEINAATKRCVESGLAQGGADSDCCTMSTRGSRDSFHNSDDDDDDSSSGYCAVQATHPSPAAAAVERSVSFDQEVSVFLINTIDCSEKQVLWWTGREAAINKKAWLHHLGQPGCGRQSAGRLRPPRRPLEHRSSSHFLGPGRRRGARGEAATASAVAADSSDRDSDKGFGANVEGGGFLGFGGGGGEWAEDEDDAAAAAAAAEPLPIGAVGILGCRCEACLTEGEEQYEHPNERQERLRRHRWQEEDEQDEQFLQQQFLQQHQQQQIRPRHKYSCSAASAARGYLRDDHHRQPAPMVLQSSAGGGGGGGGDQWGGAARGPSNTWPPPMCWVREDDVLGRNRSMSCSPGSAASSSPLYEACQTYDRGTSYFL